MPLEAPEIEYDGEKVYALFYLPIIITRSFFAEECRKQKVEFIPKNRIYRIRELSVSKEIYSKS